MTKKRRLPNSGRVVAQHGQRPGPAVNPDIVAAEEPERRICDSKQQTALFHHERFHSGPIPAPDDLRAYETISPGLADRIVRMAESQSQHRQMLEQRVITSDCRRSWGGIIAGLLVALFGLSVAAYVICQGHDTAGTVLGGATLVSLVSSFLYGTYTRKTERLQKAGSPSPQRVDEEKNPK